MYGLDQGATQCIELLYKTLVGDTRNAKEVKVNGISDIFQLHFRNNKDKTIRCATEIN